MSTEYLPAECFIHFLEIRLPIESDINIQPVIDSIYSGVSDQIFCFESEMNNRDFIQNFHRLEIICSITKTRITKVTPGPDNKAMLRFTKIESAK